MWHEQADDKNSLQSCNRVSLFCCAGVYLTCTMAITTLAMVATVFVGNLYETSDRPVPNWARVALLHYAARLLSYCTRCVDGPPGFEPPPPPSPPAPAHPSDDEPDEHDDPDDDDSWHRKPYRLATLQDARPDNGVGGGDVYRPRSPSASPGVRLIVHGSSAVGRATAAVARRRRGGVQIVRSHAKDWMNVGAVCDRLFFWLCLCLAVITTVVLFHPLMIRQATTAALDSVDSS